MAEGFDSSRHRGRQRPPRKLYEAKKHRKACKFFLEGTCKNGPECRFFHDVSQKRQLQEESRSDFCALPGEEEVDVPNFRCIFGGDFRSLKTMEEMHHVKTRINRLEKKIYLKGSEEGKEAFRKELARKIESITVDYLEVPEDVATQYLLGRGGQTFRSHLDGEDDTSCEMCFEMNKRRIKLMSLSQESIDRVKLNFIAGVFATTPRLDGIICLDTAKSKFRLCFKPHKGYHLWHLSKRRLHTLQLDTRLKNFAGDSEDNVTSLQKGIAQMRLEEPLAKSLSPKKQLSNSKSSLVPPDGLLHEDNLLYIRQWLLTLLLDQQEERCTSQIRIEGRIGKLLWTDLSPEIASCNFDLTEFQDYDEVLIRRTSFSTHIQGSFTDLTESLGEPTVIDTYDFKLSSKHFRRLDLRIAKLDGGKLKLYAAFANEAKKFTADWLFLDKQCDARISLNARTCVPTCNSECQKFLESIKLRNERLIIDNDHNFRVLFLRHKILSCYTLDRYCVEIAKVRDFHHSQCNKLTSGTAIDPTFPKDHTHYEIELQNLDWLAAFCLSAEDSSDEFFRILQRPVPTAAKGSDKIWDARKIVDDFPNFMENLQSIVDILDSCESK